MKEKKLFIDALNTLFFSWDSEAPEEVIWGANEILDWYEKEYNVVLGIRFDVMSENFNDVIKAIEESSK